MVVIAIPSPDSNYAVLRQHFIATGAAFSCFAHDRAIHSCLVCLKDGENVTGKQGNPGGRHRFCSEECAAVFEAYERKRPKIGIVEVTR